MKIKKPTKIRKIKKSAKIKKPTKYYSTVEGKLIRYFLY